MNLGPNGLKIKIHVHVNNGLIRILLTIRGRGVSPGIRAVVVITT